MPRPLKKHTVGELALRVTAIVLSIGSIVASSACIDAAEHLRGVASSFTFGLVVNGWFIFLSSVSAIFQVATILDLFFEIRLFYTKIPLSGSLWYLIIFVKLLVSSVCIIGYLVVVTLMTALSTRWLSEEVDISYSGSKEVRGLFCSSFKQLSVSSLLVLVLSFGSLVCSIAMVIFILLAKNTYKWPEYCPPSEGEEEQAMVAITT